MRSRIARTQAAVLTVGVVVWLGACSDAPTRSPVGPEAVRPTPAQADEVATEAPANDDLDQAVVVSGLPFTDTRSTVDATTAPDDPDCIGQGPTVWYVYTPAEDGWIEASTFGSDYDTALSAYTGTGGSLTQVACNDDAGGTTQSQVRVQVVAGEPLYFMVGAFASGPGGNLVFHVDVSEAPEPLTATISLDPTGSVDPQTGIATVRGTVTCSRPAYVDLFGILQDRVGRVRVEAVFGGFAYCDGTARWEAQVFAQNAYLVGGPVQVTVQAAFYDPQTGEFVVDDASSRVVLRGAGRRGGPSGSAGGASARGAASPFRSLSDVMRSDRRLKVRQR
jgi:hypothetical protein